MTQIRACMPEDIPAVAALFQTTFRNPNVAAAPALQSYLRQLFLEHPWYDPELASKVFVAPDGRVGGFIGIIPARMTFRGEPIRAAIAGSLMVERPQDNPLAGARLLRSFFTGPQDLGYSETANPVSYGMWERLGGAAVPSESLEWIRVFEPASAAVAIAAETAPWAKLARPVGYVADAIAAKLKRNPFRLDMKTPPTRDSQASEDELIQRIPEFAATYSLRPAWDAATLRWFLTQAAHKRRHGTAFRRIVHDKDNSPIGCYLYYGRPRQVAWVLQILARSDGAERVIDSLFAHAYQHGCVAVRGRTQSRLIEVLMRRRCLFFHRSSTVVHSANGELIKAIRSGDALMTGLAGEAWTRLIGDTFA